MNHAGILIDPQIGFAGPEGSLAKAYGAEEIESNRRILERIQAAVSESAGWMEWTLVFSEYRPGQFTGDDLAHPLRYLCVPGQGMDCSIAPPIEPTCFSDHHRKTEPSALHSGAFVEWVDRKVREGITTFVLAGLLAEHCVIQTAIDLAAYLRNTATEVVLGSDLIATRRAKIVQPGPVLPSEVLAQHRLSYRSWDELRLALIGGSGNELELSCRRQLRQLIMRDEKRIEILRMLRTLALPDAWVAAGFVRNLVWQQLFPSANLPLKEVDVIYFNPVDLDEAADSRLEARLRNRMPDFHWDVKNQARMHLRNEDSPYRSASDAMQFWSEKETAVAVALAPAIDDILIAAPFGLAPLFGGQLTYNAKCQRSIFEKRIRDKPWLVQCPTLKVRCK